MIDTNEYASRLRVIAAAPQMLEALKDLVELCKRGRIGPDWRSASVEEAEALIAQVEGR